MAESPVRIDCEELGEFGSAQVQTLEEGEGFAFEAAERRERVDCDFGKLRR